MIKAKWWIYSALCFLLMSFQSDSSPWKIKKSELTGEFTPSSHPGFKKLKSPYTTRSDAWLRIETADAFIKMANAAKKDGVNLVVVSATRNKSYQRRIWERKWAARNGTDEEKARDILKFSSMPGTSRHHWGTDLDINNLEPEWWTSGRGLKYWNWMNEHAWEYGFFQPYTGDEHTRLSGYKEERWHWSYHPQSSRLLRAYNTLVDYNDLNGFSGSKAAKDVMVIENYVNGIYQGQ